MKKFIDLSPIPFAINVWHDNPAFLLFEIFEIDAWTLDEKPIFLPQNKNDKREITKELLSEAQIFAQGFINYEGCLSIIFNDPRLHFCGRNHAGSLDQLFGRLFDEAALLMPDHKKNFEKTR